MILLVFCYVHVCNACGRTFWICENCCNLLLLRSIRLHGFCLFSIQSDHTSHRLNLHSSNSGNRLARHPHNVPRFDHRIEPLQKDPWPCRRRSRPCLRATPKDKMAVSKKSLKPVLVKSCSVDRYWSVETCVCDEVVLCLAGSPSRLPPLCSH